MNEQAKALGLEHTHFENPIGLDEKGHYSCAGDLVTMAGAATQYPEFRRIVATEYASVFTPDREIPLASTNELLFSYRAPSAPVGRNQARPGGRKRRWERGR